MNRRFALGLALPCLLLCGALVFPTGLLAAVVVFSSANATYQQAPPRNAGASVDNVLGGDNGWSVGGGQFNTQTAVFQCAFPLDASSLLVTLLQAGPRPNEHINEFRLSVTSDAVPNLDGGNWSPLVPLEATSTATTMVLTNGHVRSLGSAASTAFEVVANAPFSGITAFRLEVFPYDWDEADSLPASLGRSTDGNFTLTEFQVTGEPLVNIALGKPVTASAATWGGLVASSLTDGDPNTFAHPLASSGTLNYYFQIDLQRVYRLDRILLRNRADGCCPERLSDYRVQIYSDNGGTPGAVNWSADFRTDGSYSGVAGVDTITAANNPAGTFAGRFVRIVNLSNAAYNPQVAEVEVYGAPPPTIRTFTVDDDTLVTGQSTLLRWQILNASSASISPGIGAVPLPSGSISIAPTATTTYALTASNELGTSTATVQVGLNVVLAPPQITEFLASNSGNLADEDGASPDWIELRNPNSYHLELGGYYLTDDPTNLTRWAFPNARIAPNGYRIVFASDKDRRDPLGELHTNFKLDADGDYLALVDRDGLTVLQQFPVDYPATNHFPRQKENVSYGLGSTGGIGFMRPPTPGATNGPAFQGVVADTSFSIDRGFYDTNFSVVITSTTPGATIRYTLNGSEPTATSGSVYSAPIRITNTTVLRAAAFRANWAPTDVDTHTYIFLSNVIASAVMNTAITRNAVYGPQMRDALRDVPSLSLVSASAPNDTTEVRASVEWLRPDGQPGFQENCGVIQFGGAFTQFAKESFRLHFRTEYGAGRLKYPLFEGFAHGWAPTESFDALEIRNGSHDMNQRGFYMSNVFTDDTLLDMGQLNPHGRFAHLYLNGVYWGLFHVRERWAAGMHQSYLGGTKEDYESINGNWNVGGWAEPGSPYDGDGSAWARIKSLRNNYAAVKPYLDVPQYVDYMLTYMFGGCESEYRCVGPTGPGSGFKFYLNDADGWFCGPFYCAAGDRTARGTPGRADGDGPGSIFSMLFAQGHPDYRVLLADRIRAAMFEDGALTPARNAARLNDRCTQIQRAFFAESARWNYLTPAEWASRRDSVLSSWLPTRTAQALAQWRAAGFYPALDAPTFNQEGGIVASNFLVAFTGPAAGAIYYTTNGTDPRLPGGAVSPAAQVFSFGGVSEVLIPVGSRWRWFTDAAGLGSSAIVVGDPNYSAANWKHPSFDDSSWSEGPAQLGYGEGDEQTVIPYGSDPNQKWTSSYFRQRFTVTNAAGLVSLTIRLKRDDGAVIYLNGQEAARSSMPAGVVTGSTAALAAADDGQNFNVLTAPATLLHSGTNVIAVELHQSGPTTSDASFDLELAGTRADAVTGSNLTIARNAIWKARAKNATEWSALNEAFFQVGASALDPGEVVISELNFNPPGSDATEFVELLNISTRAVNLRGARFTNGITYTFPDSRDVALAAGQRLVLVSDLFAFQQRYGLDIPVAGIFAGSLDNGGERLTLVNQSNDLITTFRYDGAHPWPVDADGGGYTLVLAHPSLGVTNPAAWRLSTSLYGNPGGTDATVFTADPAADSDHDGLVALVEYALGTSDTDANSGPGAVQPKVDASGRFVVALSRNLRADDVLIWVEYSPDLINWDSAALLSTRINPGGTATETWGVTPAGEEALFLRVRVAPLPTK